VIYLISKLGELEKRGCVPGVLCRGTDEACALGTAERGRRFVKRGGVEVEVEVEGKWKGNCAVGGYAAVQFSADQNESISPVWSIKVQ
jgi:hypothetical protein